MTARPAGRSPAAGSTATDDPGARCHAAWKAMDRNRRATLASAVTRGHKGGDRRDAALMLWWGDRELQRGFKPGLKIALVMVAGIIAAQFFVSGMRFDDLGSVFAPLPLLAAIPMASWYFRRPKVQMSMRRNATYLTGRDYAAPPTDDELAKILRKAKLDG